MSDVKETDCILKIFKMGKIISITDVEIAEDPWCHERAGRRRQNSLYLLVREILCTPLIIGHIPLC